MNLSYFLYLIITFGTGGPGGPAIIPAHILNSPEVQGRLYEAVLIDRGSNLRPNIPASQRPVGGALGVGVTRGPQ